MGEPAEMIVGNRLLRFCCGGCLGKVRENPASYIARINDAWRAAGAIDDVGEESGGGN